MTLDSVKTIYRILIVFILVNNVIPDIIISPQDTEAVVGRMTYLNCSTSNLSQRLSWYYHPHHRQHATIYIYLKGKLQGNYPGRARMDSSINTGKFNLIIQTVEATDAGKYFCLEEEGNQEHRIADLIVLDDVPTCISKTRDDGVIGPNSCGLDTEEIQFSCSVSYHGNVPPKIEWTQDGKSLGIDQQIYSSHVTSLVSIRCNFNINCSSFVCQTTRSAVEQYGSSPTSAPFKILYALDNLLVVQKTEGEEASCVVNSSQSCSYKWIRFDYVHEKIVSNASKFIFDNHGMYRCEAECAIRMRKCRVIAGQVEVSQIATSVDVCLYSWLLPIAVCTNFLGMSLFGLYLIWNFSRLRQLWGLRAGRDKSKGINFHETMALLRGTEQDLPRLEISGMAVIADELYICRLHSPDIALYDSETFIFKRNWRRIQYLKNPVELKRTRDNRYFFIFDFKDLGQNCEMFRVTPTEAGELPKRWPTGNTFGEISVTDDSHVIMVAFFGCHILEYSSEGDLVRKLDLYSVRMLNPWHCIKLSDNRYLVSHGKHTDKYHSVSILNVENEGDIQIRENDVVSIFGGDRGFSEAQMDVPVNLAVGSQGSIYVSDHHNNRVLILDSELRFIGDFLSQEHGLYKPRRLWLEEAKNRMLVIDDDLQIWDCDLSSDERQRFDLQVPRNK